MARGAATAALLLLAFACAGHERIFRERDDLPRPVVDRLSEKSFRIRWPESFSNGRPVTIYEGTSPDAIDRSRPLAVESGRSIVLRSSDDLAFDEYERHFFELVPASGNGSAITAERRLPLEGLDNFRDIGGYATSDGRSVRWGRLYRANDLSDLTKDDVRYLSKIGVKLVCDFRSDAERALDPDKPLPSEAEELHLSVEQDGADPTTVQEKIRTGGITELGSERIMLDAYRSFVTKHKDVWSAMFWRIANPSNLPTVVHCTAGKDRTGFAAALVLFALGVPEETVFEDYLATNHYRADFYRFVLRWIPLYSLFRTKPESLEPLIMARREYLEASIQEMEEHYGSIDSYLEDGLGLTPDFRDALRANLLR